METKEDVYSALESVGSAIRGKKLTQEEIKEISKDIQKDKAAQSAISEVTGTYSQNQGVIKYCPIDGKHFSPHLKFCPEHQVELKESQE